MKVAKRDLTLLQGIASVPSVEGRERVVHNLEPVALDRVARHVKAFILQKKGYKVRNAQEKQLLVKALAPHASAIKRLVKADKSVSVSRKQKGGQIFSFLIAVLAPVVMDLIAKAAMDS